MSSLKSKDVLPMYWELLSEQDKSGYKVLRITFNTTTIKSSRGHRIETFDGILGAIHQYAEKGQESDWKRFLVCGVCWVNDAIAINTRQLRILISKCKSSINGSLQKLGYYTNTSHSESWKILFSRIPLLKDNYTEIRQWTIRQRVPQIPVPLPFSLPSQFSPMGFQILHVIPNPQPPPDSSETNDITPLSTQETELIHEPITKSISNFPSFNSLPIKFRAKFQNFPNVSN